MILLPLFFKHSKDDGEVFKGFYTNEQIRFQNFLVFFFLIMFQVG